MSYVKKTKVARVTFEPGHPLHGLEIKSKPVDMGYLAKVAGTFAEIQALGQTGIDVDDTVKGQENLNALAERMSEVYGLFVSKIVSWNYQMEDENDEVLDVPPTVAGLRSICDDQEVLTIIHEWLNALSGVSSSLGKDSDSGGTIRELSELMEPLSASQAS